MKTSGGLHGLGASAVQALSHRFDVTVKRDGKVRQMSFAHGEPGVFDGVLMLNLDHFEAINDRYGHLTGDQVLRAVAQELAIETRDYDTTSRFGGEEFIVLLPEVDVDNDRGIAERIRRRIHALVIPPTTDEGQTTITDLTVSIGAAMYPSAGISTLEELLQAADAALYEAKDNGRSQIHLTTSRIPAQSRPRPAE